MRLSFDWEGYRTIRLFNTSFPGNPEVYLYVLIIDLVIVNYS